MFCDNCGCELEEGITVCPVCGKIFSDVGQPNEPNEMEKAGENQSAETYETEQLIGEYPETMSTAHVQAEETLEEELQSEDSTIVLSSELTADMNSNETSMAGGMPNGMPPMESMPNGMPPMGSMPNGMPPIGSMPNGMPPMGNMPNGVPPMEPNKPVKEKKKMGKGLKITLIAIPVVIIAAAAVLAALFVPKMKDYKDAADKLSSGQVEEAVSIYAELGSFKDSESKANGGAYYEYASDKMNETDYLTAAEYFDKAAASNYEDAADKAKECYFNAGNTYKTSEDYDKAIEMYEKAGDYSGAAEAVSECHYNKAVSYMENSDYDNAIKSFEDAGSYEGAADKIKECYYHKAEQLVEAKDYQGAYDNFIKSEYDDYSDKANDCIYQSAKAYYDAGDYDKAVEAYNKVDTEYKDCTDAIDECYIALAKAASKDKDYNTAIEYYGKVQKADVSKGINSAKLSYVKEHKDMKDALTMQYLGELRYAGNNSAKKIYKELVGWDIESYVNHGKEDYDTKSNTIDTKDDIYIHTVFNNADKKTMDIEGYLIYSNGEKTNVVEFGTVEDTFATWLGINASDAKTGTAYVYITDKSGNIVEVYPFTIK